jgi:hypothetical protein
MLRTLIAAVAAVGSAAVLSPVRAATIDTFSFTQSNWLGSFTAGGMVQLNGAVAGGLLSGTFTGIVEPGGLIRLGDLSTFSDIFTDTLAPMGVATTGMNLGSLTAFSHLTTGGPSTLDIAGTADTGGNCIGGAVPFSPVCTFDFNFTYPPGIFGAVFIVGDPIPIAVALDQPVITLVSSVTTTPAVPEPSELSLLAVFLGIFGVARWTARCGAATLPAGSAGA